MRFCNQEYLPFDKNVAEKSNCGLNSKSPSNMRSFKKLTDVLKFSNIDVLNFHLKSLRKDPSDLWNQIDDAISSIILQKSKLMIKPIDNWKNKTNNKIGKPFELLRFDFVIDDELKVHVMEVEMSPNLVFNGVESRRENLVAKRLLMDTLKIIGAGSYGDLMEKR